MLYKGNLGSKANCSEENKSDQCMLSKWNEGGIVRTGTHAHDCFVIGIKPKFQS